MTTGMFLLFITIVFVSGALVFLIPFLLFRRKPTITLADYVAKGRTKAAERDRKLIRDLHHSICKEILYWAKTDGCTSQEFDFPAVSEAVLDSLKDKLLNTSGIIEVVEVKKPTQYPRTYINVTWEGPKSVEDEYLKYIWR